MSANWTDTVVGERMQVDQEFEEKVAASHFSRQQWSLIMTAVEFEIEHPDDPNRARIVPVTDKLPSIVDELDEVEQRSMGAAGPPGGGGRGGSGGGSGGLIDGLKDALGFGDDSDREQLAAAEEMAQMYADDLQAKLEETGKWETVRTTASAN